jgi:acetolactate decarboxylase
MLQEKGNFSMKKQCTILLVFFLLMGCASHAPLNTITQTSTIDVLLAGVYDGEMSCGELLKHGDFGIGTFDKLDGEMIVLGGHLYQVKSDGRVYRPADSLTTPFAAVCRFQADKVVPLPQKLDYPRLQQVLDSQLADPQLFYAIRITGHFATMRTRSVPAQEKPYPPLAKVAETQPEFAMKDISGTIVGFRCPMYVKGINVPGYHLHFLSDDGKKGGHILGFELDQGRAEIDRCNKFMLIMPENSKELSRLDLSLDRSRELEKAEK